MMMKRDVGIQSDLIESSTVSPISTHLIQERSMKLNLNLDSSNSSSKSESESKSNSKFKINYLSTYFVYYLLKQKLEKQTPDSTQRGINANQKTEEDQKKQRGGKTKLTCILPVVALRQST